MFKKGLRWLRKALRVILVLSGVIAVFVLPVGAAELVYSPVGDYFSIQGRTYKDTTLLSSSYSISTEGDSVKCTLTPSTGINRVVVTGFLKGGSGVQLSSDYRYTFDFDFQISGSYAWYWKTARVGVINSSSIDTIRSASDFDVSYIDGAYRARGSISFYAGDLTDRFDGFGVEFKATQALDNIRIVVVSNLTLRSIDKVQDQMDREEDAANQQGQESIDDATSAIPNNSAGFIAGINALASSMAYTGTEAKWNFPAIKMPAISGVMDELVLSDNMEIDFSYWVQSLPSNILQVVQIICTAALIVYCFKEVYSQISYALTQKGGGADE